MTILANAKHEAFARGILSGASGSDAYLEIYGGSSAASRAHASRLVAKGSVAARIAELKAEAAQGAVIAARETLERISARARDETEGHEALQLRALELMGKHHKLFTERHEHNFVGSVAERLTAALKRIEDQAPHGKVRPHRGADRSSEQVEEMGMPARPRRHRARRRGAA
jgi:hypothetical protein